jgi:hypothetical protein
MSEERKRSVLFNGWFIVAAGFLMELTLGEAFWSFGVFFKPLENEFGWSRSLGACPSNRAAGAWKV